METQKQAPMYKTSENIATDIIHDNSVLRQSNIKKLSRVFSDLASNMKKYDKDFNSAIVSIGNNHLVHYGDHMQDTWNIIKKVGKENSQLSSSQVLDISQILEDTAARLNDTTTLGQALNKILELRHIEHIDSAFNLR